MKKKFILFYLLTVLVGLTVFELEAYQSAILFICIGGLLWAVARRSRSMIPPVGFIVVAYTLGFPLPVLLSDWYLTFWPGISPSSLEYGMLWAVRGFGAFALGYAMAEHFGRHLSPGTRPGNGLSRAKSRYTYYILSRIGWLSMVSWFMSVMIFGISLTFIQGDLVAAETNAGFLLQILTLLSGLRYPFLFGFFLLYFQRETDKRLLILFFGLLMISVIEIIAIGSKASIIRVIAVPFLASAFVSLRLNLRQAIAGTLALVIVYGSFSVVTEYRSIMREEFRAGRNVFDFTVQTQAFVDALILSLPYSEFAANRRTHVTREDIFSRFGSGMYSFANVLEFTRRQSPYEHAWESFLIPIYSIVPRTLVPEKPVFFDSGINARDYYDWSEGGVSVSLLGSLYFAWGYAGIVLGMGLFGGSMAFVVRQVRLFGVNSARWAHWAILLSVLMVPMLDVGMTFQAIMTNVIRVAVMLGLLHICYLRVGGSKRVWTGAESVIRQTHL